MERKSGVLMHVSSLFGKYSSGSFGEEAKYFVEFLADCGFS
jgi:4-alpha-glucanotransferase